MIRPPGQSGVVFTEAADGDLRHDPGARASVSAVLGISADWATLHQVHGSGCLRVDNAGSAGDGDAIWTTEPGLPMTVFTADCFGVVVAGEKAVGVAHAGWRGMAGGVVAGLVGAMAAAGHRPRQAWIGPGIGPCCFEVGEEVVGRFPGRVGRTKWGTASVDLLGAIQDQLGAIDIWVSGGCTHHEPGWFSHRRDADLRRLASIAWRP